MDLDVLAQYVILLNLLFVLLHQCTRNKRVRNRMHNYHTMPNDVECCGPH